MHCMSLACLHMHVCGCNRFFFFVSVAALLTFVEFIDICNVSLYIFFNVGRCFCCCCYQQSYVHFTALLQQGCSHSCTVSLTTDVGHSFIVYLTCTCTVVRCSFHIFFLLLLLCSANNAAPQGVENFKFS